MTSINTNIAAQTALRTLQSTNMQLDATQSRISTGLKIGEAKDNAAYWSISTTLKSDNKALGTVKDALGLGAATVDTAYQGLNQTLSALDEIKSKLMVATGGNVDRAKIQDEIVALQAYLRDVATASTFSGENWLSVDTNLPNQGGTKNIVGGFTRSDSGAVTLNNISVNTSGFILVDAGAGVGVLDASGFEVSANLGTNVTNIRAATLTPGQANAGATAAWTFADVTFAAGETLQFDVSITGAAARTVTITQADIIAAGGANGAATTTEVKQAALRDALVKAGFSNSVLTAAVTGSAVTLTTGAQGVNQNIRITNVSGMGMGAGASALTLAITETTTADQMQALITTVNRAIERVTSGAAQLGAVASRIELQQSFVDNLMDTIDAGISGLIDADMNEESTRLQALQVKQQLGVQALSIANQSAQNVLSLFR